MEKVKGYIMMVVAILILAGCASTGPKVIEKSGSKKRWVKSEKIYSEAKDVMYFRGEVSGVYDLALGKRQAEADAKKRLAEAIATELRSEYREFVRGSNIAPGDVGRFVEDALEAVSRDVRVSGMLAEKSYWEKVIENPDKEGEKPYYHVYALLKIAKKDYNDAKERVINELLERTRVDKNKEAEQMIEEWKKTRSDEQ